MKKKITAMLLAICCISSTWTVYADDFSSGSSEVEIEITEDEDADVDDVEITEDADANDEMFSDGTESSTSGGDISAMANQIVARAEIQAQEYQQLKKEAKKYADAQEVARLTNGADCSGFVMSVFANFGYELPRVAAAQYSASQKRDLSQMEVGDLVFYGSGISHVALYIGDGKVVHALNSNKGIVITDYNYDTPVGVGSYME